jgi:anti-sigma factor RsiW
MNCSQFRFNISPYLDHELSFSELQSFESHQQTCPRCADLTAEMEKIKVAMGENLQATLAPEFVPRLQARLRAEVERTAPWYRQMMTPRIMGFSPISLSGLAAAVLAIMVIGVSLFLPESAPLIETPRGAVQNTPPPALIRNPSGPTGANNPSLIATPTDTVTNQHDSSRRDFSRRMKYVNRGQRP